MAKKITVIKNGIPQIVVIPEKQDILNQIEEDINPLVDVTFDNDNYIVTYTFNDGSTKVFDFPLESMIINITYDSISKDLVITLQNGTVLNVPLDDLVNGLVEEAPNDGKEYVRKNNQWVENSSSYTLPKMSDETLGGGKAIAKTDEDGEVAVDEDGKLWYKKGSSGGGTSGIPYGVATLVTGRENYWQVTIPEITSVEVGLTIAVKFPDNVEDPAASRIKINDSDTTPYPMGYPLGNFGGELNIRNRQVLILTFDGFYFQFSDTVYMDMWQSDIDEGTDERPMVISPKLLAENLNEKVDKVAGKQLSTEDFTTAEKTKLSGIATNAQVNVLEGVQLNGVDVSISGKKSNIVVNKTSVGLGNVPNLDTSNPTNIAQSASYRFVTDTEKSTWNGKQDKLTAGSNITIVDNVISASGGGVTNVTLVGSISPDGTLITPSGTQLYIVSIMGISDSYTNIGSCQVLVSNAIAYAQTILSPNGDSALIELSFSGNELNFTYDDSGGLGFYEAKVYRVGVQ